VAIDVERRTNPRQRENQRRDGDTKGGELTAAKVSQQLVAKSDVTLSRKRPPESKRPPVSRGFSAGLKTLLRRSAFG
jgi:hypothetical protein